MQYHEPSRQLPVREFDVVVAGAGTAGVMAGVHVFVNSPVITTVHDDYFMFVKGK